MLMKKHLAHTVCKRAFGMNGGKLRDIAARVAEALGRQCPVRKVEQWALVYEYASSLGLQTKIPRKVIRSKVAPFKVAPKAKRSYGDLVTDTFLSSYEWRTLRMVVLKKHGARCQCCGSTAKDGVRINVDHVKPRKLFPALALDESNLQVLCEDCNAGKGNWDQTDWRQEA